VLASRTVQGTMDDRATAFAALLDRGLDTHYRLAAVILGDPVEAEDAVHDAAVVAWRGFASLRERDRFEAWFGRILVNGCRDRLRVRKRRPQPTDDGRVYVVSAAPGAASAAWPVTLAPGDEISIIVLGRAGECAEAGNRRTADPLFHIPVRYRVLGIEQVADVPLPATVFVAAKGVCTVETENTTITYGPPPTP